VRSPVHPHAVTFETWAAEGLRFPMHGR
jgi:hypothetical protein